MDTAEKTPQRRNRLIMILGIVLLLMLAGSTVFYFWQDARLERARREYAAPQVSIQHPVQGQQLAVGQYNYVSALAGSNHPILTLELWLDGQLIEVLNSDIEGGTLQMGRTFDFLVEAGPHIIIVRAIDSTGLVGQSLPTSYNGTDSFTSNGIFIEARYEPGMSLEDFAGSIQVEPELIMELNPEVFGAGNPEEGEITVKIPPSPQDTPDDSPEQAASGAALDSQGSGKICYPSEQIPAMTAYFQNTKTKAVISLPIAANQTQYTVPLSPGTYTAYAWLPDNSLGGTYSKAVPCGLDISCTDHTLLPFTVQQGAISQGIDICDWYSPTSVPLPPQTPGSPGSPPLPQAQIPADIPMLPVVQLEPVGNASSLPWAILLPTSLPDVPTNLTASVTNCSVQLTWNSNPQGLSGYQVWYSDQNGLLHLQAKLKPPQSSQTAHWYTFTPATKGKISIWVDAVNAIGSQSSNPALITLPETCGGVGSENLEFRTLDVSAAPGYDRVYAYLSLEGIPERRLPTDDSEFITTTAGRGDFSRYSSGQEVYVLPLPKDNKLTVEGECWGWSGGDLSLLSQFSGELPSSQWDGFQGSLGNELCQISYQIQANITSEGTLGTLGGNNLVIPAPFNVSSARAKWASDEGNPTPYQQYSWWWEREVKWQWKGDIKDISGFTIFLNGSPLKTVPANLRSSYVILPFNCGPDNKWEVVANGKEGTSPKSQPFTETMNKCGQYAKIIFVWVAWDKTCDGWPCHWGHYEYQCDTHEVYFTLSVNNFTRSFWGGNIFKSMKCGQYQLKNDVYAPNDVVFVIPYHNWMDFYIQAKFWDYDELSANDYLGVAAEHIGGWSDLKTAATSIGSDLAYVTASNTTSNDSVSGGQFLYIIILYPNENDQSP